MDIGNVIVLLSIVQAVLLIILLVNKKQVKIPAPYLIALLVGLVYFQIEFLLVRNTANLASKTLLITPHGGWLMMGPLLYFFVKSFYEKNQLRHLLIHLLPFLLIVIIIPLFIPDPIPKRGYDYGMLSVFTYRQLGLSNYNSFYGVVFFLQFIHLGGYIFKSARYNQQQPAFDFSNFIKRLLGISVLTYVACLLFYVVLLASSYYSREWDYFLILPTAVFIYFITFFLLSKPELWRDDLKLKSTKKYERSALPKTEIALIAAQADQYLQSQRLYIDPELSLESLAQNMSVSRHKLSQAINRQYDMSFNDYINQFRITEAQQLLTKHHQDRSILSIAYESGFNNKATFNKYFKKHCGQTPSSFIKELKKGKNGSD